MKKSIVKSSSSSRGPGRTRGSISTVKEMIHDKDKSPKRLSKVNKYEGVEVSPSASLFKFDFGKKKKGSNLNSSVTGSEEEGENSRLRTRRSGSSNESRGDSRKAAEKGGGRKTSEKDVEPVPPKKSKVGESARSSGKVAENILEENEEEGLEKSGDDSDLNDIFDKTGKEGKKEAWLKNLELQKKVRQAAPAESVIRNSPRPSTSSNSKGQRPGSQSTERRGKEKLSSNSKDSSRSSTVDDVPEEPNRDHSRVARNLEDLMDAGESDSLNNTDQMPGSSNGNLQVPCLLDSNLKEYKKLRNAFPMDHINVQLSAPCASYTLPSALEWTRIAPGVQMAVCFNSHNFKSGYLRIAPGTVKPMERVAGGIVCFALIDGRVVSKSSSFAFKDDGTPYLTSVELVEGSYIIVPRDAAYSLENWSEDESSLHFVIYSDSID